MSVKISSLSTASTINSGDDINIAGNNPLAFSDWGGGWFMQDSVWIRSYNNKSLWMNAGLIGGDGGLTIGYGGASPSSGGAIISGSVGIGTTSPANKLVIKGGATYLEFGTGTNYADILAFNRDTSAYKTLNLRGSNITFSPSDVEKMQLTNGGSLLLGGNVTPAETAWFGTAVFGKNGTDKIITGYLTSSTNGATIGGHNSALDAWAELNIAGTNLIFRITQTEMMRLNSGGDLLVGTATSIWGTANRGIIQLNGTSQALIGLSIGGASKAYLFHQGTNLSVWNEANGKIEFGTNNTLRLTIEAGGDATFTSAVSTGGKLTISTTGEVAKFISTDNNLYTTYRANSVDVGYIGSGVGTIWGGSATDFGIQASNNFVIATGGATERFKIASTGAATFSSSVTATNFIGAGTGLTGTASSLSIGGDAGSVGGIAASRIVYGGVGARQGVTQITDWNQSSFPNAAFLSSEGSIANAPTTDFTYGVQTSFHRSGPDYRTQFVTSLYGNNVYWLRQLRDTAGWSSWVQVIHSGNISSQSVSSAGSANAVYLGGNPNFSITDNSWAGAPGYHGYSYTGSNYRFGFSSTGGYIDVYTDGNFYAGIDLNGLNNLVLHTGNYTSYAATVGHTHDLGRYSLQAPAYIDGLTAANFRSTLFGLTSNTFNISAARWNTTPTALPGMNSYGTMLAWSGADTQGFIATDYSGANITVGGGNGNNINWTALLITSANIGGQSVAFATTAGALTSMDISQFTNDSGYVTSSVLGDYLPLTGGALTGNLTTNSSIGIGTASPATALDVVGGAYSNTTAKFGNTKPIYIINDDPHIGFNTYYNSGWFYGAGSSSNFAGALGCAQTTGDFTLQTSTAAGNAGNAVTFVALMTWKQNGFVGIGTNVPSQRLEVNGNIKLSGAGGATATPSYIWLGNDYSNGVTRNKLKIYLYNSGTEQYGFTVGSIGDVQYHSNSYHDFYIANTLSLRINSSGDVGIGTASPQGKLSVDGGNINFNYGNVAANYYVYLNHNNSNDGGIIWQRNNSNDWQMVNAASSGDFWMYSYSTATVSVAIKRVTGYVGIGTLSPEFLLDVAGGNARINGVMVGKGSNSVSTNLAVGVQALYSNTSGSENTAVGYLAMYSTTTAIRNTALGNNALYSNTTGASNVAVGVGSLYSNIVGRYNSSVGYNSMQFMRGEYNSALGRDSMRGSLTAANNTGEYNTAVGYESMLVLTSGNWNTAVGNQAGANLSTGSYNTFIGRSTVAAAGGLVTTGSNNTIIGGYAGTTTLANTVVLADGAGQVQLWATGKNVALGTTSPTTYANYTTLHIAGQTTTNGGVLRLTTSDSSIAVNIFTNNAGANYDTTTSHSHLFNINGASSLIVSSSGIETAGSITTADPGLGAAAWQLGDVQNATISLITNRYVEVVIGGSSYQLALVQLE